MRNFLITICVILQFNFIFGVQIIKVYPQYVKQSSEIYIRKGDLIEISVTGKWTLHDQYQPTDAEGYTGLKINEFGNWGALLGQIGNSEIFIIGKNLQFVSKYDGVLYLFPNHADYKFNNPSGYLEVNINGGIELSTFKKELERKGATKIVYDTTDDFIITDILVNQNEKLEIYSFGYLSMNKEYYPLATPEGHENIKINSINFGKLYAGIGSSFGEYLEIFPVGERISYTTQKSGLISFFPYIEDYKTNKECKVEIFILGGKKASTEEIENFDTLVIKLKEKEILKELNDFRALAKLPLLEVNNTLTENAISHAKYLIKNRVFTRNEISSNPYFTGETPQIRAQKKNLNFSVYEMLCESNYPENVVSVLTNTVFHRLKLQDPRLKYIGFGYWKENKRVVYVLDLAYTDSKEVPVNWEYSIFPPHDYTIFETAWKVNEKLPVIENNVSITGAPITVTFRNKIKEIKEAVLFDEESSSIECYNINSTMGLENINIDSIALVPKKELKENKKYTVKIKVTFENNEEKNFVWSFITKTNK